jgi:LAO/AO transport system kinase
LVVNKADRDGVQSTVNALHTMLDLGKAPTSVLHHGRLLTIAAPPQVPAAERWRPPILKTIAAEGTGIAEVLDAVAQHRAYLSGHPEGQQRARVRAAIELETILREALLQQWLQRIGPVELNRAIEQVTARTIDPYSAAEQLLS